MAAILMCVHVYVFNYRGFKMAALCIYLGVHLKYLLLLFIYGKIETFEGIRDVGTENLPVRHQPQEPSLRSIALQL